MDILDLLIENGCKPVLVASTYGGEYKSSCPGCGGTDRFCSWPAQGEGGTWWCRNCKEGGGTVRYLMKFRKMSAQDACSHLGIPYNLKNQEHPRLSKPKLPKAKTWKPNPLTPPDRLWQAQARRFVFSAQDNLIRNHDVLAYLESRGLDTGAMKRAFLGFNPDDLYEDRAKWGLPELKNDKGVPKKLWLPRGIVIPCYRNGQLVRIRIRRMDDDVERDRRSDPDREPVRYCILPGGDAHACMALDQSPFFVVVESELDAILLNRIAGDLVSPLALGSAQNRPDVDVFQALKKARAILMSLDADSAGANEAWNWWQGHFPNTIRWAPVNGKDPGEMLQNGENLRSWIASGLKQAGHLDDALALRENEVSRPTLVSAPADKPLADALEPFTRAKRIAVNLLATGNDPFLDQITMIYLTADKCPVVGVDFSKLPDSELDPLRRLFESDASKVFFHAKPQLQFLWQAGFKINGRIADLMIAEQLVTAGLRDKPPTLDELLKKYLGQSPGDEPSNTQNLIYLVGCLEKEIRKNQLKFCAILEFDCIPVTARMELNGMRLDVEKWEALKTKLEKAIQDDAEKAKSISRSIAFMENAHKAIHPVTGRIHAHYEQIGAKTGRFSCSNPNMQGIPKDPEIRACFVGEPGYVLIKADYSQIQLRILAEVAEDEVMINAFRAGKDLHRLTASLVSGTPYDQVTQKQRDAAKAINFGMVFGMGAESLANSALNDYGVEMTVREAVGYIDRFFDAYPGVKKRDREIKRSRARETTSLGGRKRFWDEEASPRALLNSPIQGTESDIMKTAMVRLSKALAGTGARIVGCNHDELVVEAPEALRKEILKIVQKEMVGAGTDFLKVLPVCVGGR